MEQYFDDEAVVFLERKDFDDAGRFRHKLPGCPMVVMFGGSFCPHCRNAAPAFNAFAKQSQTEKLCIPAVVQVDKSAEERELGRLLGTLFPALGQGVPSYALFGKDGVFIKTHEGDRSKEALIEFAKKN